MRRPVRGLFRPVKASTSDPPQTDQRPQGTQEVCFLPSSFPETPTDTFPPQQYSLRQAPCLALPNHYPPPRQRLQQDHPPPPLHEPHQPLPGFLLRIASNI